MPGVVFSPRQNLAIFIGSLFLLLVYMSYQVTDPATGRTVLGNVLFSIISPVESIFSGGFRSVGATISNYFALTDVKKENEKLKKDVEQLQIQLAVDEEQKKENDRLRKLLELRQKLPINQIAGEVVGRDAKLPVSATVIVNRGTRHGVKNEMPVVSVDGVVGMTIRAGPYTSQVLMITDPSAEIGAMVQKDGSAGILSGMGNGHCVLKFLPLSIKVQPGDLVVTSGQDQIFPSGLSIGKVIQSIAEPQYMSLEIEPFENTSSVKQVVFLDQAQQPLHQAPIVATPVQKK